MKDNNTTGLQRALVFQGGDSLLRYVSGWKDRSYCTGFVAK